MAKRSQSKATSLRKTSISGGGVQVISRAAKILRMLSAAKGLSITSIAKEVQLSRSTVHRILTALEEEQFVTTNGPGGYKIGPAVSRMAESSKMNYVDDLMPYLSRLSANLHETVDLSILTGHTVTFVEHVVAARRLQAVSAPGISFPLHCSANGKAILSAFSKERQIELLPPHLERFTGNTCIFRSKLMTELDRVTRIGYSVDNEEHTEGICAVSVALLAPVDEYWAISVPLPASRFRGHEAKLATALIQEAKRVCTNVPGFRLVPTSKEATRSAKS